MVVLVTGCRSGFGLGIAVAAARRGHVVYAGLRDLETRAELVEAAEGLDVRPVQLDVTDAEQRDAVVARMLAEEGRVDGLVNNAGIALGGYLEQLEEDELRRILEVNVIGQWGMTRAVLPGMRERRAGRIVMMSSVSGVMALPGLGAYATSKFALEGMAEAWRHELALFDIDVYLVEPGAYRTEIWGRNRTVCRRARDPEDPWSTIMEESDRRFAEIVDRTVKEPDEVIDRVCDLLDGRRRGLRHPMGPGTRIRRFAKMGPFWIVQRGVARALLRD